MKITQLQIDIQVGKLTKTRRALSREHAYATTAYLEHVHHYFGTYKIFSHSYQAYTMFVNKKSLFWHISNFLPLPLGPHRPCRAFKPPPYDSPCHSVNFKPKYTSLCQLEAEIWPKMCFWPFRRPWPWPLTFRAQKLIILSYWPMGHILKVSAKSAQ